MRTKGSVVGGVAFNDATYEISRYEVVISADGKRARRRVWTCPVYEVWMGMLKRCYSNKVQAKHLTYEGCTVCDEWLTFSNFKSWMEKQDWQGKQIDKDILFQGNKIYSPATCVFVSRTVNAFVIESDASRGKYLIGVSWHKVVKKFSATCNNPITKKGEPLGYFTSEIEAHKTWLKRKLEHAKLIAAEQDDPRVAKALVERYENYKSVAPY